MKIIKQIVLLKDTLIIDDVLETMIYKEKEF